MITGKARLGGRVIVLLEKCGQIQQACLVEAAPVELAGSEGQRSLKPVAPDYLLDGAILADTGGQRDRRARPGEIGGLLVLRGGGLSGWDRDCCEIMHRHTAQPPQQPQHHQAQHVSRRG